MSKKTQSDSWGAAWSERYDAQDETSRRRLPRLRRRGSGGSRAGRYALASAVVIAVVAAPFAVAAGTGRFEASNNRYTLLSRNTNNGDGGAGAMACTSNTGNEPCLNMVNKGNGYAAAFRTRGVKGFRLQTSGSGTATPFILDKNATGIVDHFNADMVDGKNADEIGRQQWALVNGSGATPTLTRNNKATAVARTTGGQPAGDYTVTFTDDVNACSYQATPADDVNARTISATGVTGNNKQVHVTIRDAKPGATQGDPVDDSFQVSVVC
jgi:hypothetical protein